MADPFDSLRIRPGEPGDLARIRKDWRLSMATSDFARFLTPRPDWKAKASQLFWDWSKEILDRLLAEADVWIACWQEEPSAIVGWCVMEMKPPTLHFVSVLPPYRNHHVARKLLAPLLEHRDVTFTHRTHIVRHLPVPPGWIYDPRPALVPRPKETAT